MRGAKMSNFCKKTRFLTTMAAGVLLLPIHSAMAGIITVDGVRDGNDAYTHSFTANWTNEHHSAGSVFTDGTDETTVWWELDSGYYYLFIEAPLEAKNMLWGSGMTAAELLLYDVHNTSLGHHDPFVLSDFDHEKATKSEKTIFAGIEAKLKDDSVKDASGLIDNATSHSYLDDNGICNDLGCAAAGTTMSFEFKFDLSAGDFWSLLNGIAVDGIEFHLSPERGALPVSVPEPGTLALLVIGLAGMGLTRRRRTA